MTGTPKGKTKADAETEMKTRMELNAYQRFCWSIPNLHSDARRSTED
jgi:hypothetical protein